MPELTYVPVTDWPPLTWLARCREDSDVVTIFHGTAVETRPEWFCEGAWDGPFEAGGLDETDLFFGSGGRLRLSGLCFLSSYGTLDRLHSIRTGAKHWISNSLPCLTSAVGARADPTYPGYTFDFRSVQRGLDAYVDTISTSAGPIRLTYHRILHWTGHSLEPSERPSPRRDFGSFGAYRRFLESTLRGVIGNAGDGERIHRYPVSAALSSGYDSPAIAVLAQPLGLKRTFGLSTDRHGDPDDGRPMADRLGLEHAALERGGWHDDSELVATFLAADANGSDLDLSAGAPLLAGSLFLSGTGGLAAWQRRGAEPGDGRFGRRDSSGLSLQEYRLQQGFLHVPVPLIGLTQADELRALAASPEMEPWSVDGVYNRPVPRRILEEAGVPRGSFATAKRGVSLLLSHPDLFWKPWSGPFLEWLDARKTAWIRKGRIPPRWLSAAAEPARPAARAVAAGLETLGGHRARRTRLHRQLSRFASKEYLYLFLFPWALERLEARYRADEVVHET